MAHVVPKRVLEEIRFKNDIVEVIGSYFTLKPAGATFRALCPFHKEKTPSFHVNPQRQIFHCFGCGAGGDVFGFIQQHEGVDFMDAVKILAQRGGVRLEMEDEDGGKAGDKETLFRIHAEIAAFYQRCLLTMASAAHARAYLEKRDLGRDVIEEFLIGYAPNRWDAAIQWGRKNKYTPELLERAGLVLKKSGDENPAHYYDRFRNRVVFAILDAQSRVIGFSARTLEEKTDTAKYVNSPETPIFQKSRVLYALDKARRHIVGSETREAIVCEGQIDCIRCHVAGFKTAVAAQGTAFTEDHARILRRFADSAVLVFDSDRAGQDAAIRTAGIFMEAGLAVSVASLPQGDDPDSFIRKNGPEAFRKLLDAAQTAVGFQIDVLSRREKLDSEVGLMRVARAVLEGISRSPNAVQRAKLVQLAAERLNLPVTALDDDLRHLLSRRRPSDTTPDAAPAETAAETPPPPEEERLCEHVAHASEHPEIVELVRSYLPLQKLTDALCRRFAEAALNAADDGRPIVDSLRDGGAADTRLLAFAAKVQSAPAKARGESSPEDAVKDLILRIWRRDFERQRAALAKSTDKAAAERSSELTYHLNRLRTWEDGAPIIACELGE